MSKTNYEKLTETLCDSKKDYVTYTFDKIEEIIGAPIPESCIKYHSFKYSPLQKAAEKVGYGVKGYDVDQETLTFGKKELPDVCDYSKMINEKDNDGRFLRLRDENELEREADDEGNRNCDYVIKLTKHNSEIIEEMIQGDNSYFNFTKIVYEHFKKADKKHFPRNNREAVFALARIVDITNFTDVWKRNRESFNKIVDYIMDKENCFWARLKKGEAELVDDLVKHAKSDKSPYSFASKICKYFAEYEFPGSDKYFINDSVVRGVLPFYYRYYLREEIKVENSTPYVDLYKYLCNLQKFINKRKAKNDKLTKNELDHILWYCYKNSGNKEEDN